MTVLFENERQAGKTRKAIVAAVVWAVGWFYWAMVMAHVFGALPGSEAVGASGSRPGLAALMAFVGVAPFAGLLVYSRIYLIRIEHMQDVVTLTTLGVFSPCVYRVPQSAIVAAKTQTDDRNNTGVGKPVWITLRVAGRRLPFVADLQAERADMVAITALAA
jgi:hypothetical protein